MFPIWFEEEEDLDKILEGRPWLFWKQMIIFDKLTKLVERNKIRLVINPFWIKVSPCLSKCGRKDLMHAIETTFGGVIRSKIKGKFC